MPLDSIILNGPVVETEPCPLAAMGLRPISEVRIEAWKQWVTTRFRQQSWSNRWRLEAGLARWRVLKLRLDAFAACYPTAPQPVKDLARRILAEYPHATGQVHYFDIDPILLVDIRTKTYGVAIWDRGVVRAIADGAKLPPGQHLRRLFVKTV